MSLTHSFLKFPALAQDMGPYLGVDFSRGGKHEGLATSDFWGWPQLIFTMYTLFSYSPLPARLLKYRVLLLEFCLRKSQYSHRLVYWDYFAVK